MDQSMRTVLALIVCFLATRALLASEDSIGPNGINSIGLGLDGSGVAIGQVEGGRSGKPNFRPHLKKGWPKLSIEHAFISAIVTLA